MAVFLKGMFFQKIQWNKSRIKYKTKVELSLATGVSIWSILHEIVEKLLISCVGRYISRNRN